ncbi:HlyD family efflux transporter periplasmic adaptor subunit [Psychrobacillus glaciei]|uniref:HlyD family efflux transporter periplasmic adaptor subunit n=1 Tax=Psychrobacillus glaciei TaxID=2283160 RepID=A0A5J6SKZ0_9BACI|nr:HlyD family efflux transporter periplasmic adaptor subunit [Psychrobacillus glaciei]QFF98409.1 HlyD family efflux transporter periplasmic adaptor subunit [Psychrobacillus glaciei]
MSTKQKKKGKKKFVIWSILGLVILGVLCARLLMSRGLSGFDEETVKSGDITTYYSFSGVVESKNRQNVMSEKVMQIDQIKVKEGDKVKKDDVLLKTTQGDEVKASIDGEVSKIYIEENAQVMSGMKLMDIVDYTNLQTSVKVDEYDLKYIALDKDVQVTISALDKEVKGSISAVSKEAINDHGVSYFTATIDLTQDDSIRVGMSAEAKILNQSVTDATTITMKAIQFDENNKPYVLISGEKNIPVKKYIQAGVNDGTTIELKSGLVVGDVILIPKTTSSTRGFGPGGSMGQGGSPGGRNNE